MPLSLKPLSRYIVAILCTFFITAIAQSSVVDRYNVVWSTPSKSSAGSMPVGGHSVGLNVWVENGDLLFYAQRSGSFTENNEYHKLGRFRVKLSPNPFKPGGKFRQELKLNEGYVQIKATHGDLDTTIDVWVDAHSRQLMSCIQVVAREVRPL